MCRRSNSIKHLPAQDDRYKQGDGLQASQDANTEAHQAAQSIPEGGELGLI
jgi:hypothetical protein